DDDEDGLEPGVAEAPDSVTVYTIRRSTDDVAPAVTPEAEAPGERAVRGFTRWNAVDPRSAPRDRLGAPRPAPRGAGGRRRRERSVGAGRGAPSGRHRRARGLRRRHLRHQGARALL